MRALLLALLTSFVMPAVALAQTDSSSKDAQIEALEDRVERLEALLAAQQEGEAQASSPGVHRVVPKRAETEEIVIDMGKGAPRFSSNDGTNSFNLHARIQSDAVFFDDDQRDLPTNADIRRLWFGAAGNIAGAWSYNFYYDFASGTGTLQDAWLA